MMTAPASRHRSRSARALSRTPRHVRTHRRSVGRGVALTAVALLSIGTAGGAAAYNNLQGNIETHDVTALLGDRPTPVATPVIPDDPNSGKAMNILVMGSDKRSGAYAAEGDVPGMRADTTFVVHLSADRSRADIVNIPRDLLVDIPSCTRGDGSTTKVQRDAMFNSAFSIGGEGDHVENAAACTIKTVEQMTGVFIDDYVVVDFAGFIGMINAIGGIDICVPEAVKDTKYTHLVLPAGQQTLAGEQAFLYARVRHGVGDGSDISRISRQQAVIGAMLREVLSKNYLNVTNLPALYSFLDAATESLTTSPGIGKIPALVGLANSARGIDASKVSFVTLPFDWAGPRVKPNADSAALWAAIAADQPIKPADPTPVTPTTPTAPADGAGAGTTTDPGTTTPPPAAPATTTPPAPTTVPWDVVSAENPATC